MKKLLLAALLVAAPAMADLVASSGANELRLLNADCTNPAILAELKPEFHPLFKKAQATIGGKVIPACWIDTMEGAYFVKFEGGAGLYPIEAFSEAGI
jgi:hypothetical protein